MNNNDPNRSPGSDQWDTYWNAKNTGSTIYSRIASFYRRKIIKQSLERTIKKIFRPNSSLLHAGCGSGEVDTNFENSMSITAIDFSMTALREYQTFHPVNRKLIAADLFKLPFADGSFDGVFNLGVMEHLSESEIVDALTEIRRVLTKDGQVVFYWPPVWGLSVIALLTAHKLLALVGRKGARLHPVEHSLIRSRRTCEQWFDAGGLQLKSFRFGWSDLFTHERIVGVLKQPK
jgi:SAM-dependent methyltransferase